MQRKATKNTRGPNATEKAFHGWLKQQPCAYCGRPGPSIVDHARGATFRHNKTLIGHAFCTSKCDECDSYKTLGSHNRHYKELGKTESEACLEQIVTWSLSDGGDSFDEQIVDAITDFSRLERMRYAA